MTLYLGCLRMMPYTHALVSLTGLLPVDLDIEASLSVGRVTFCGRVCICHKDSLSMSE